MPTKKNGWPTGLQNKPVGSRHWFQIFSEKHRRPRQKWVKLRASTLARALIERGRLIADYESNQFDPWLAKADEIEVTLEQTKAEYLATKAGLAPNSLISKRQAIGLFLASLSTTNPAAVEVKHFQRFFNGSASHLKASSKKTRLAELSTFFKFCMNQGYAPSNPASDYKQRQTKSLSRYDRNREKREGTLRGAIMPRDFRRVVGHITSAMTTAKPAMQSRHALMLDLITFGAATGLRRSELAHLCQRKVELGPPVGRWPDTGIIEVCCWEDPRTGKTFRTKSGTNRHVRLTPVAARIAARHLAGRATEDDFAPLFLSLSGQRLFEPSLTLWFGQYCEAAGLPEQTSFHSLRHSFASWLLMMGVDVLLIQEYMGHASLAQMEHYGKVAKRYLTGDARGMRREILKLLCPDLSPRAVEVLLPARAVFSETLQRRGLARRRSVVAIEDTLFDGAAYEVEAAMNRDGKPADFAPDLENLIGSLLTS